MRMILKLEIFGFERVIQTKMKNSLCGRTQCLQRLFLFYFPIAQAGKEWYNRRGKGVNQYARSSAGTVLQAF